MTSYRMHGFTLIELVVVVAIIGILAAIAMPSYRESVLRANRTDAKNALVDLGARQERFRFTNNAYATSLGQLNSSSTSAEGKYTLTLNATATSFRLTATPTTSQADDRCGVLTLDNTGAKGTTNSHGLTAQECWR